MMALTWTSFPSPNFNVALRPFGSLYLVLYSTTAVSFPSKQSLSQIVGMAQSSDRGENGFSSLNSSYYSTIDGFLVIIHWCRSKFPVFIPAQESIWHMNWISFVSLGPNLNSTAGSILLISIEIGRMGEEAGVDRTWAEITNNLERFLALSAWADCVDALASHAGRLSMSRPEDEVGGRGGNVVWLDASQTGDSWRCGLECDVVGVLWWWWLVWRGDTCT